MSTVGITYSGDFTTDDIDFKVALWCNENKRDPDGTLHFHVINGAWDGSISPEGHLVIPGNSRKLKARVVWEGDVPAPHNTDYNSAIEWINSQISGDPK